MNNLEPRAKIGDVVIVDNFRYTGQLFVVKQSQDRYFCSKTYPVLINTTKHRMMNGELCDWEQQSIDNLFTIEEIDILKNLTTNVSYASEDNK